MSSLIVPVAEISKIRVHPNADRLEIAEVLGWQVVVGKGLYKDGEKVVYFPPDTLLPAEWADKWSVRQHLKGVDKDRIGKVKLRDEPSFGLIARLPEGQDWPIGENVHAFFGAQKYTPPLRSGEDVVANHPLFDAYTDIENMRNFPTLIQDGEEVVMTEKLHGTNCRIAMIEGVRLGGSRHLNRKGPLEGQQPSHYWFPWKHPNVANMMKKLGAMNQSVILYGEVFGKGIQDLGYNQTGWAFAAFDMSIDGKYLDHDQFAKHCTEFSVPMVPFVYRGPFSLDKAKEFSTGKTLLGGTHVREGVVVKPVKERRDPAVGRVILKYVGDDYLLRADQVDYTEA